MISDSIDKAKGSVQRLDGDVLLLAGAIAIFLAPTIIAPLTYPAFYEDESWLYLSTFEALRGNGLSLAALGEGQSYALVFFLIVSPFVALSPLEPELTIRLIHTAAALGAMLAAFVIVKRLAPRAAALAPALIAMTPLTYSTLRYGRVEVIAVLLGLSAIAAALRGSVLLAGLLSALAVCVHPILIWIGAPCLIAILQRNGWQGVGRYSLGGVLGLSPQVLWLVFFSEVSSKYWLTSSLAPGRNTILESVASEPQRYVGYVASLNAADVAMHALLLGLALFGFWAARGMTRWLLLAIGFAPLIALALFSLGKNPYYFVTALCALAIAAAFGASRTPRAVILGLGAAALTYAAWRHLPDAWASRHYPTVTQVTQAMARQLPEGAVVFTPLRYAGILRSRPDLRLFSYHALYNAAESTAMTPCANLDRHIVTLAATDTRESSRSLPRQVRDTELLMYGMPWEAYLRPVYHPDPPDFACLINAPGTSRRTEQICGPGADECGTFEIARRPLSPGRDPNYTAGD